MQGENSSPGLILQTVKVTLISFLIPFFFSEFLPSLIPYMSVLHCFFSEALGNTVKFDCFPSALCLEFAASIFLPRKNTWAGRIVSFSPCVITETKKRKFSCPNKIFNLSSNKRYHLFLLKLPGGKVLQQSRMGRGNNQNHHAK